MAETIQTKHCPKCKQIKPTSEFNKSKRKGLQCYCKSCQKLYAIKYYKTEKGRAAYLKGVKKYQKTAKGKTDHQEKNERYFIRYPERRKAMTAVNHAIRVGKIPRPDTMQCQYGTHPADVYHHHKGYAPEHWLDVVPACRRCHAKLHIKSA